MQDMDQWTLEELRNEVALLNGALYSLAIKQNNSLKIKLCADTEGEFHCAAKITKEGNDLYLNFIAMPKGAKQ